MYEEIYENPMIAIQLFASHLGMQRSDAVYAQVVQHSQIDEMRSKASIGMNHLRKGKHPYSSRVIFCLDYIELV